LRLIAHKHHLDDATGRQLLLRPCVFTGFYIVLLFFLFLATAVEVALVRRYIHSCAIPEVCMGASSPKLPTTHLRDNAGASSTSLEEKHSLMSPRTVAVLPTPCNSMSPVAGEEKGH
jgi:hypothetical protein